MGLFSRKRDPERELAAAIGRRGVGARAEVMYDRDDPQRVVVMGSTRYKVVDGQLVEVVDPKRPPAGS